MNLAIDRPTVFDYAINDQIMYKVPYSIISAGTGAGKTTTYPCKLVKAGIKAIGRPYKVIVVLPTKEGTDNGYTRASTNQIDSVNVDFSVGRARDGDVEYSNYKGSLISNSVSGFPLPKDETVDTDLVYCTFGHFKNRLEEWNKYLSGEDYVSPRSINTFDFVIIDEAHLKNKNMNVDIILGNLKYLLISYPKKGIPQVVLTSATYKEDTAKFYTIQDVHPFTKTIEHIPIFGNTYEEKVKKIVGSTIEEGLYGYIISLQIQPGIILMFLPGNREITSIMKAVQSLDVYYNRFECVILHSKLTKEQKAEAFTPNKPGKWKLILSTNIAETSLTIPNVLIVIDFPYENIKVVGKNQTVRNQTQLYAKDSADQRAGRTGRTNNGYVLRLIHPDDFEALPDTIKPEIERLPIGNELLKVLDCNIDYRFIFGDINKGTTRSISKEQGIRITKTLSELAHFGLVKNCNGHYSVTPSGRFVADLPLGNKGGILILRSIERGIDIYPAIVLACMIESTEVLFQKFQVPTEFQSEIPFSSILKPWLMFCLKFGTISIPGDKLTKLMDFCDNNGINYDAFREAQRKIINCITIIRNKGYPIDVDVFEPEDCFMKYKDILSGIYFHYKLKNNENRKVYISTDQRIKHIPLPINNKFLKYNFSPEVVVSVFNMEYQNNIQMMLWYPIVYEPTRNFDQEKAGRELIRLDMITERDIIEETPEELEEEQKEAVTSPLLDEDDV